MVNGRKTAKSIKKKYGENFYSDISKKRKTFSGGKGFVDVSKAKEAQRRSVIARKRNRAIQETLESPDYD